MNRREPHLLAFIALWAAAPAAAALGFAGDGVAAWLTAAAAFVAVLVHPGLVLLSRFRREGVEQGAAGEIETVFALPASAFAVSLALVFVAGRVAAAAGAGPGLALVLVAATVLAFILLPGSRQPPSSRRIDAIAWAVPGVVAALGAAMVFVAMTAGGETASEPALWGFAQAERAVRTQSYPAADAILQAGPTPVRWRTDPWIVALGAWGTLSHASRWVLYERLAPVAVTVLAASAALALARTIFPAGTASLAAVLSLAAVFATRVPSSAIGADALPVGMAEDTMVAAVVLLPTVLAAAIALVFPSRRSAPPPWMVLLAAMVGLAATDAAAAQAAAVATAGLLMSSLAAGIPLTTRAGAAVVLVAVTALLGLGNLSDARFEAAVSRDRERAGAVAGASTERAPAGERVSFGNRSVAVELGDEERSDDPFPPSQRSLHGRSLIDLGIVGTALHPSNVADPLLILTLAGAAIAVIERTRRSATIVGGLALSSLGIAFFPVLSSIWIGWVSAWRAPTALWVLPSGPLIALFLLRAPELLARRTLPRLIAAIGCAALTAVAILPWLPFQRLSLSPGAEAARGPGADRDLRRILARIRELPDDARLAAGGQAAALIPALTGLPVVAADPLGTRIFATDATEAVERRFAAAALTGLAGGSDRLRTSMAERWGVTHVLLEDAACDGPLERVTGAGRFSLCRVGELASEPRPTAAPPLPPEDLAGLRVLADLDGGWTCQPRHRGVGVEGVRLWTQRERWSARPVSVACSIALLPSTDPLFIEVQFGARLRSPAMAWRIETLGGSRGYAEDSGRARPDRSGKVILELPDAGATSVRIVLVSPAPALRLGDLRLFAAARAPAT